MPEAPSLQTSDLPGVGGGLGTLPEHFRVAEVEAYAPAGEGDHWYVRAEKRGLTTPELVAIVARAAGVAGRDVGHAGLKDKHAITEQWLSLPAAAEPPESWQLPDSVRVLRCTRHKNKLRTGH
jgi:tRNA pseudouridine13 synthase